MDFNLEAALVELDSFQTETSDLSPLLEDYLQVIAKTGNILFPWNKLQPLLKKKIELVLSEFAKTCPPELVPSLPNTETFDFEALKASVLEALDSFPDAPFTIQRLCELIVNPRKYYSRTDKYMRGLEKNLLVVSTIDSLVDGNPRNNSSVVNGSADFSTEASYEGAPDPANGASMCSTPANGTVLENFATVFPSATRMAAPSNSIQVPEISESNDFLDPECSVNFDYDISDNASVSDIENGDGEIMSDAVTDSTTVSGDSENIEEVSESPESTDESTSSSTNDDVAEGIFVPPSPELVLESLPDQGSTLESESSVAHDVATCTSDIVEEEESACISPMSSSVARTDTYEPSAKRIKLDNSAIDNENTAGEDGENKLPEDAIGYDKEGIDDVAIPEINHLEHEQNGIDSEENVNDLESESEIVDEASLKIESDGENEEKAENGEVGTESTNDHNQEMIETEVGEPKSLDCGKEVAEMVVKTLNEVPEICSDS